MNHQHRKVLHAIFTHPVSANISFKDVTHVLEALGAEIDNRSGRRVGVKLRGHAAAFSHAQHSLPTDEVAQIGRFLETCGISPDQFPVTNQDDHPRERMRNAPTATLAAILVLAAAAVAIAQSPSPKEPPVDFWQPLWMQRELWGPGTMPPGMRARLLRHHTYMQYGVQPEYQGAKSTVGNDKQTLEAGAKLYEQRCSSCHGKQGMGDGDAPRSLLPSPALLAFMIQRPISVDEYLLWSISEGGKQFDTEMPAFKTILSREEIWKIIAYMRVGFRSDAVPPQGKERR